ncbi:MAG: hypothetical protein IPK66_08070 [Rhodospirillales bacterium]|nr:hypothetical protein [Rhodospirillales bacterium]
MLIDRAGIATLIPHAGAMCLLDGVLRWDDVSITCVTYSHRAPDNPLRSDGRLEGLNALEYGAQAAAIHGGLLARQQGRAAVPGYLAAIRHGTLTVRDLAEVDDRLMVSAHLIHVDATGAIYDCSVNAGNTLIASARISIVNRPDGDNQR